MIVCQILQTNSLSKFMEISLENLNLHLFVFHEQLKMCCKFKWFLTQSIKNLTVIRT